MFEARYAILTAAGLAVLSWGGAWANEAGAEIVLAEKGGAEHEIAVRVDPSDPVPPVVTVPKGARVRLTVTGIGEAMLHLHGYDVGSHGAGERAVLVFDAAHEGRFPVEAHVEDDLLGRHGKPILFVEVRGP